MAGVNKVILLGTWARIQWFAHSRVAQRLQVSRLLPIVFTKGRMVILLRKPNGTI